MIRTTKSRDQTLRHDQVPDAGPLSRVLRPRALPSAGQGGAGGTASALL